MIKHCAPGNWSAANTNSRRSTQMGLEQHELHKSPEQEKDCTQRRECNVGEWACRASVQCYTKHLFSTSLMSQIGETPTVCYMYYLETQSSNTTHFKGQNRWTWLFIGSQIKLLKALVIEQRSISKATFTLVFVVCSVVALPHARPGARLIGSLTMVGSGTIRYLKHLEEQRFLF